MQNDQFNAAKIRLPDGSIGYDAVKLASIPTEGFFIKDLQEGSQAVIRTKNSVYTLNKKEGKCHLQGGRFLPESVPVHINGSTWGGSMLKMGYIGVNMYMEVCGCEACPKGFTTSPIESIVIKSE